MLLTGPPGSQGHGYPSDEIRFATGRVPNLWFGESIDEATPQRFHVEVYVPPEMVDERVAGGLAAGGVIDDDSNAPAMTVLEAAHGNRGVICADTSVAEVSD